MFIKTNLVFLQLPESGWQIKYTITSVKKTPHTENPLRKAAWTNVSDLRGQQNQIALRYGVNGIPTNFLIDPRENIIARDLQGKELSMKLKVLLQ